jgi:hypothetical protein
MPTSDDWVRRIENRKKCNRRDIKNMEHDLMSLVLEPLSLGGKTLLLPPGRAGRPGIIRGTSGHFAAA